MPESPTPLPPEVAACRLCAEAFAATATAHAPRPVAQIGPEARLLVAGQAPGMRVQRSGLPFDDPSGDRLRCWMGLEREAFYDPRRLAILPMAFCFPGYDAKGADLPPPKRCAETWRAAMLALMPRVELVLAVGQYAQAWHLGRARSRTLTETVRNWRDHMPGVLPLPHPSWRNTGWLKRNAWFESDLLPVLRAETARLTVHRAEAGR